MNHNIKDKYLNFVLSNHSDIEAFLDVVNHGREKLVLHANNLVNSSIYGLESEFEHLGIDRVEKEQGEISWWATSLYDDKQEIGPFFGCATTKDWRWLVDEDGSGGAYIYLYLDAPTGKQKRKQYIDEFCKSLTAQKSKLRKNHIVVVEDIDYEDPYIARYNLSNSIRLDDLKDPDEFRTKVQQVTKKFTSQLYSIIKDVSV